MTKKIYIHRNAYIKNYQIYSAKLRASSTIF